MRVPSRRAVHSKPVRDLVIATAFADTRRAHDIAEALGLPTNDYACTDCDWKTWEGAELDDDGRCWACAARIRNEKRSTT